MIRASLDGSWYPYDDTMRRHCTIYAYAVCGMRYALLAYWLCHMKYYYYLHRSNELINENWIKIAFLRVESPTRHTHARPCDVRAGICLRKIFPEKFSSLNNYDNSIIIIHICMRNIIVGRDIERCKIWWQQYEAYGVRSIVSLRRKIPVIFTRLRYFIDEKMEQEEEGRCRRNDQLWSLFCV